MKEFSKTLMIILLLFIPIIANNSYAIHVEHSVVSVSKINNVAFDLYHQLNQQEQNMVVSPYSLSSLLGKLTIGANGDTRKQLLGLFHASAFDDINNINLEFRKINAALGISNFCAGWMSCMFNKIGKSLHLKYKSRDFAIANALWANKDFVYRQSFIKILHQDKSINFFRLDFKQDPEESRKKINNWVEQNTNNYIRDLLPSGSVTPMTRLILTNAIYFKGKWEQQFDSKRTEEKPFLLVDGGQVETKMMNQEEKVMYMENDLFQMVQLNYSKSPLAMAVILPKLNHSLQEVLKTLNAETFLQLSKNATKRNVNISIPKFKIESTLDTLIKALQAMGLKDAFNEKANFSNITDSQLIISDIIQKAMIQVDEEGTIAAAATAVGMVAVSFEPPVEFNANHPFLFMIFDRESNALLFMGQVINPQLI